MQGKDGDNKGKAKRCLSKTEERLRHHAPEHSKEGGWWGRTAAGLQYAGQLHYKMSTRNDSSEVCARDYGKRRFFRDGKNCSMQGLIHGLRYEMSQLGEYVCIMEFDLEERYYRYLNSYKGGHEAKVMERIRILVLIPF